MISIRQSLSFKILIKKHRQPIIKQKRAAQNSASGNKVLYTVNFLLACAFIILCRDVYGFLYNRILDDQRYNQGRACCQDQCWKWDDQCKGACLDQADQQYDSAKISPILYHKKWDDNVYVFAFLNVIIVADLIWMILATSYIFADITVQKAARKSWIDLDINDALSKNEKEFISQTLAKIGEKEWMPSMTQERLRQARIDIMRHISLLDGQQMKKSHLFNFFSRGEGAAMDVMREHIMPRYT